MIPFRTLVPSRSPDILLSFYQIILFLNLVREIKKIVLYILLISMSRKLLEDHIFTFYFTFTLFYIYFFYCLLCSIFLSFRLKKIQSILFCLQIEVRNSNIFFYLLFFIYLSDSFFNIVWYFFNNNRFLSESFVFASINCRKNLVCIDMKRKYLIRKVMI